MNIAANYCRELWTDAAEGWNRFWFTPARATTLGLIRVLAGAMLLYTHLVWSLELESFFGEHSWISPEAASAIYGPVGPGGSAPISFAWSYFWLIHSSGMLWTVHIAALVVMGLFMVGWQTRVMSVLSALAAISYVNRVPGALFGLDQIN